MNIFKDSYKIVRENSDEIYKGFGFRHLSDATQYYVHPNNQSYRGTTTLCQPIGEGITLFSLVLRSLITNEDGISGDILVNSDKSKLYFKVKFPEDWKDNGIIDNRVDQAVVLLENNEINLTFYDENQNILPTESKEYPEDGELIDMIYWYFVSFVWKCDIDIRICHKFTNIHERNIHCDICVGLWSGCFNKVFLSKEKPQRIYI